VIYGPARHLYQCIVHPSEIQKRRALKELYSRFLAQGNLAFDVGANIGEITEIFLSLGAQVVAIEPHPQCARSLRALRSGGRLIVEEAAAGPVDGVAEMHWSEDSPRHGTLSSEWWKRATSLYGPHWQQHGAVPMVTLGSLVEKHGSPRFIKIDVEGFGAKVMAGLPVLPRSLSFEFLAGYPDDAYECLERCPDWASYNLVIGSEAHFHLPAWVGKREIADVLARAIRGGSAYGDVFAERCIPEGKDHPAGG
jgi:FkbM family methyltransferase